MLLRAIVTFSALLLLSGCQQTLSLPAGFTSARDVAQECHIDNDQLGEWLKYEHRFISSTLTDKQELLIDAEARQQNTLYFLLLSTPGQSAQHVARALERLAELQTQPAGIHCDADQYLQLRIRQLQQQLNTQQQLQQLELDNQELKRQVDALTDLERQITRQREEH